nr:MAG TPA: hypothetical protein [Caudoviricetes sp.]
MSSLKKLSKPSLLSSPSPVKPSISLLSSIGVSSSADFFSIFSTFTPSKLILEDSNPLKSVVSILFFIYQAIPPRL